MKTSHDKNIFKQRYDMDLVVVGGGVTGVVAAIAAARLGVKTLLVHNRPVLGGVSSNECIFNANGSHVVGASEYVNRNARETGIIEELRLEARYLEANGWTQHWSIVLRDFCERENHLTVLLNTEVYEVETKKNAIKSVTARTIGSEMTVKAYAPLFIDCSGDSFLGFSAGAEYRMGREGRDEFGETLAPEKADGKTMGSSVLFRAVDVGHPVSFKAPSWAYKIKSDEDLPYRVHHNPRQGWWWLEYGGEIDTIADNEKIYSTLLRVLYGIWDHVKNGGDHGADNYVIEWISHLPGKRESRRLIGDLILTQNDVTRHTNFPDAVAYGGWPIDIHPPEGIFGKSHPGSQLPYVFPGAYQIPFRCLYSKNIKNLMMAGRNISVSHIALGTTRVTATCALCGQAVGSAAFLSRKYGAMPREIGKKYISEFQEILALNDIEIPGRHFEINGNIAGKAHAKASSSMPLKIDCPNADIPLMALPKVTDDPCDVPPADRTRAQMFSVSTNRIDAMTVLFNSTNNASIRITARLRRAERANDFSSTTDLSAAVAEIPPGKENPVRLEFNADVEPGVLYWINLDAAPGVGVCTSSRYLPGLYMKADGCYFDDSNFCFEVFPAQNIFGAENAINGFSRAGECPNMWVSDPAMPMPQYLELDFDEGVAFDKVEIIFDSNLNRRISSGASPVCVRDYELHAITGGIVRVLEKVTGNYQRRRIHGMPESIYAEKLRLVVNAANGDLSARVYEIRVFKK